MKYYLKRADQKTIGDKMLNTVKTKSMSVIFLTLVFSLSFISIAFSGASNSGPPTPADYWDPDLGAYVRLVNFTDTEGNTWSEMRRYVCRWEPGEGTADGQNHCYWRPLPSEEEEPDS